MQNTEIQKSRCKKVILIFVAAMILAVFFGMLCQEPWSGFAVRNMEGTVGYVENPWVLKQGDTVLDPRLELPEYTRLESGKLYTLSTRMTYNGNVDDFPYGFIHLDHVYCRILLDGKVLFSYMPEDLGRWDNAKSPGFIYKAFLLPRDCMGKTLTVELLPPLSTPIEYGLPEIHFGDYYATLHKSVVQDMPHNVVTLLCMLMGIAAVLFSSVSLSGADYREGISIGGFSLLFSLYLLTECDLNAFFVGNPYYLYLLNYIPFTLMPISLMGFMRERLLPKHRKVCTVVIGVGVAFFLLEMVFHFGGILDMRELIPAIHLLYFAEMALVTVFILTIKDKKRKHSLYFQIMPVIIGMLLDALIYWLHWEVGGNDATFTILGVILFLFIELVHVWKSSIAIYTESARSNLYRQMAFVDGLTGAGNRRAYDNEIERIATEERRAQSVLVISADVNKLKYVNDHYGHAAGDKLIRSASQYMMEATGGRGKVFRTGGDEFAIFLYHVSPSEFDNMWTIVQRKANAFNQENEFPLSLAMGYVQLQGNKIMEAVQEADRRMYANKLEMKMAREQMEQEI